MDRPGTLNWDVVGPAVERDLKECEAKFDTLSPRDQQEYARFRDMMASGKKLNIRNVVSLRRIAKGMGAL